MTIRIPVTLVPLTDVAPLAKDRVQPFRGTRQYLATGSLNGNGIVSTEDVTYETKPSRADLAVASGDVICARMQATTKVLEITGDRSDLIVSTGFAVHRPDLEMLFPRYLYHFLSSPHFQRNKDRLCSGATQKAITNAGIKALKIPIPKGTQAESSLDAQRRLSDVLDKVESVRCARAEALALVDKYLVALFHELFGDVYDNRHEYPVDSLEKVVGGIIDCPHSTPKYARTATPFLCVRSSDIQDGYLDLDQVRWVSEATYTDRIERHEPSAGEVVYTREGGRLGNAAQIPEGLNICLGQRMMLFYGEEGKSTNEYIWALMNSPATKHQVENLIAGAAAPRVNISDIRKFEVIRPPYQRQLDFSKAVKQVWRIRKRFLDICDNANDLSSVILSAAFQGGG